MKPFLTSIFALALGATFLMGQTPSVALADPQPHLRLTLVCEGRTTAGSVDIRNTADDTPVARLACDAAGMRVAMSDVALGGPDTCGSSTQVIAIITDWRVILTVMGPREQETQAFHVTSLPARLRLTAVGDPQIAVGFEAMLDCDGSV